ncbi:MAG TPA: hypothetical protein VKN76_17860, partial [Kiloniellaceae bacterium]|nr:hypothetical protein [Kiloniellaceae bacterium]
RPGYQPPWLSQSSATQLALSSLKSDVSNALVRSIPTAKPLSEIDLQSIVAKAQGNPFFLEELAWALGSGSYSYAGIPETVQSLLAARIDALALPDKRLLQIAAVVGPEVPHSVLVAIDGLSEGARQESLLHLQTAEFLYECQTLPLRIFAFKHALTQEVAYLSLVARTRKEIHRRIADALEVEFHALVRGRPELVAHHLTESGEVNRASRAWLEAGRRAIERSANAEAVAHLTKALELLASLPDGPDRREREIATRLAHGVALQFTEGPGAELTEGTYRKAAELCGIAGDGLSLFFATWGLWRVNSANSKMQSARDLAGDLLRLAEEHKDPTLLLQAHHAHWTTLYNHGEFDLAADHIARGLELYDPAQHGTQAFLVAGHDPRICAHTTAAQVLWVTGFPEQAMKRTLHASALADGLAHPSTRAIATNHMLRLCISCRDLETVKLWQKALRALASEYEFPGHNTCCDLAEIWVNARGNGSDSGISEMIERLAKRPDLAGLEEPMAVCLIADSCRFTGLVSEGLKVLRDLQARPDVSARSSWSAEFDRLMGELLLAESESNQPEAEACFRSAMATASRNRAKVLELRSATSLARLWDKQGRSSEAYDVLAPVYSWFTEGHDTRDLLDARQLLEKLSR